MKTPQEEVTKEEIVRFFQTRLNIALLYEAPEYYKEEERMQSTIGIFKLYIGDISKISLEKIEDIIRYQKLNEPRS